MAREDKGLVSQETLCEIAGVTVSTRRDWTRKKRLRDAGRSRYDVDDAVELAALAALAECLGPTDVSIAWDQIRPQLPPLAASEDLVGVFDMQDKVAWLELSMAGVRSRLKYGHPILIVDLAEPIGRVRAAFDRVIGAR